MERQRRKSIRSSLVAWAKHVLIEGYTPAAHHLLLMQELEAVALGKTHRLAFFLPPGSAKSHYASMFFPPWFLAQEENRSILAYSHSGELAEKFGGTCRNLIENNPKELGYVLSKDSRAKLSWSTNKGGEYFGSGVGANHAGRRADLGLIDDPIGKKEDADSKTMRDKLWDWYEFDFLPRLKPGSPVVLIQTRWHEDDLAGRLLAREAKEWRVVHIPFIAFDNDPLGRPKGATLWPEWYEKNEFAKLDVEKAKKSGAFSALYQGQPTPEEGDFFKKEWLETYNTPDQLPKELRFYVASDHALTKKQENDKHCVIPLGIDTHDDIWILPDVWWNRGDTGELVEAMIDIAEYRRPIEWWAEDEHIYKGIGPFLNKRMQERKVYFVHTGIVSSRDLMQRAASIRGSMKMRKVHFPSFASWWPDARHELLMFPNGTHDDFVAALAKIGQGLDRTSRPSVPKIEEELKANVPFVPTIGWLKSLEKKQQTARYGGR